MDLFHRHRSKYYALLRQWHREGLLHAGQEEQRKKASLLARDSLVHYDSISILPLHEEQYCFSSFHEDFDPILPLFFTKIEKQYLKTLLPDPLFRQWMGAEALADLEEFLSGSQPFPVEEFFRDMSQGGLSYALERPADLILIYESIVEKRMIAFSYYGTDGIQREKQLYFPYRLMLDKETGMWQLLAFTYEHRYEVVCNLERMSELSDTEEWFSEDLQELMSKNRENQVLSLKVRTDMNSIERTFLSFHDYPRNPRYDRKKEEYYLDITYNPMWDMEDLFTKVMSIGGAVEVLSPPSFREKVREELGRMLAEDW